jgi:hypothetical protein
MVLQTLQGRPYEVRNVQDAVTQYSLAKNGTVGILAHVEGTGSTFDELEINDVVTLYYGETSQKYKVTQIQRYLASNPYSIYSDFTNIETGEVTNSVDLGPIMYYGYNRLVMQTCYDGAKGRLFVIAYPYSSAKRMKGAR